VTELRAPAPDDRDPPANGGNAGRHVASGTPRGGVRDRHSLANRLRSLGHSFGPGLITGAADDDPSGISTYSQAGAAYGYGLLWTAVVTWPLMIAVQLMCARIGTVARAGLASVLREHYSARVLWFACALLLVANTVNIAADLGGMGAAAGLLTGAPSQVFVPLFAALVLALLVFASYAVMTRLLKWLTWSLFAYVVAAFLAHPNLSEVIRGTLLPQSLTDTGVLLTIVALLGTTISPYLFFWQAAQNAEEDEHLRAQVGDQPRRTVARELRGVRADVVAGMTLSNGIMYFIILTAGATLHRAGLTDVQTAQEAAQALRPISGALSSVLFAAGIIGPGMLGVPVLAGSAAYAVAEARGWARGMDLHVRAAPHFYTLIGIATVLGTLLDFTHLNPIRMLFWSAVINGLLAPPLILIVILVCNNSAVMGKHRNGWVINLFGGLAALLMSAAAIALVATWL
jgi:NRAMP (natural resistance-associated macrophage protein)-like metal ion transporter